MKTKLFFFTTLLTTLSIVAQPEMAFQKNYGGTQNDIAYDIKQTNDGGYVLAGYVLSDQGDVTNHNGQRDFWIVKTDVDGNIEWEKAYGGTAADTAYSIQQTSDNGYIVAGETTSVDGDITENFGYTDIWVIKLDSNGDLQWQKSYGDDDIERAWEVQQTTDGGYVLTGYSWIHTDHRDYIVIKTDATGNVEWQNIFGFDNDNPSQDQAHSIKQTADGGYIIAGQTIVYEELGNPSSYGVVKLNAQGNIEWNNRYGGTNIDSAWNVQNTIDGGYVVVGYSTSDDEDVTENNGGSDFWIIKLDNNGILQWEKSYGGSGMDRAFSVVQSNDGNYLIAGLTNSTDGDITTNYGDNDGWVIKLNPSGALLWEQTFGGSESDYFRSIIQTSNGGYAISGTISSEDIGLVLQGDSDYWFVSLESETLGVNAVNENAKVMVYPNPVSETLYITSEAIFGKLELFDILGKLVYESKELKQLNVSHFSKGVYLLRIHSDGKTSAFKIVIQ